MKKVTSTIKKYLTRKTTIICAAVIVMPVLVYVAYVFVMSPRAIQNPTLDHYHFRMQIIVDGKAEDFSQDKYQKDYQKNQCNAALPEQPIHFHDGRDQLTHIHWKGVTGGMVMKYYGWNFIGGIDGALGYKLNDLTDIQKVTIHGNFLPTLAEDAKFYVYTGDETTYQRRDFNDWKTQDLEQFFGKSSSFPRQDGSDDMSIMDRLFPTAYAHNGEQHSEVHSDEILTKEELQRINNLLGNVVIFIQHDEPREEQIKARFDRLEPLLDSVCGG